MRALVTGGAGYVGSHVVDALLEVKAHIVVLDNFSSGIDYLKGRVKVDRCFRNIDELDPKGEQFDVVVHCAARSDIRANWTDARERERLWADNFALTLDVLELIDAPMVFVSSSSVYGTRQGTSTKPAVPCREDQPTLSESPYAASKVGGEALVQAYAHKRGKPWHILRPGIIVGARYWHGHIADFVKQATETGSLKSLSDGRESRTVVNAKDFARAVQLCAAGQIQSGIYNVGHGVWSPRQTVGAMLRMRPKGVRWDGSCMWTLDRIGWVGDAIHVLEATKLRGSGWAPTATPQDGVGEALLSLGWHD